MQNNYFSTFISKNNLSFTIKTISENDIELVYSMQNKIVDSLEDKDWFCPLTKEELIDSYNNDYFLGVYHENELAGYGILIPNRDSDRNLFFSTTNLAGSYKEVATAEVIAIDEKYRGHALQSKLFSIFNELARKLTGVKYLLGTVCPKNKYSLNNFLRNDYSIYKENIPMYGGYTRNIMKCDL